MVLRTNDEVCHGQPHNLHVVDTGQLDVQSDVFPDLGSLSPVPSERESVLSVGSRS